MLIIISLPAPVAVAELFLLFYSHANPILVIHDIRMHWDLESCREDKVLTRKKDLKIDTSRVRTQFPGMPVHNPYH